MQRQVLADRFNNVSEVVRAGLHLLDDQQTLNASHVQELKNAIAAGAVSGEGIAADEVFAHLESKYPAQTRADA